MSSATLQGNLKVPNDGHIGSAGSAEAITIDSNGNVGIGTTTGLTNNKLNVTGKTVLKNGGEIMSLIGTGDQNNSYIYFTAKNEKKFYFGIEGGADGDTANIWSVNNDVTHMITSMKWSFGTSQTFSEHRIYSDGNVYVNGTSTASGSQDTSDDRIKYNEENISGVTALSIINQLQPQKYEKIMKTPDEVSGTWMPTDEEWPSVKDNYVWGLEAGLIAQDIQTISELSFTVNGEEVDGEGTQTSLNLNYNNIFTYHIAATKELSSQLDIEKAKVSTLETDLTAEKAKTATLETQMADLLARVTALENP